MGNRNRTAGIRAELQIAQELREIGFDKIVSTRSESKRMDDAGVDLIQLPNPVHDLPCYFQIKKTLQIPREELLEVDLEKPLVIIHQKQEKRGSRFYTTGEYAIMKKEFLYKLLNYILNGLQNTDTSEDGSYKASSTTDTNRDKTKLNRKLPKGR